jgi:hypothetical protein
MPDTFKGTSIRLMLRLLGFYVLYSTLKYLQRKARNQVPAATSGVPKDAGVLRSFARQSGEQGILRVLSELVTVLQNARLTRFFPTSRIFAASWTLAD